MTTEPVPVTFPAATASIDRLPNATEAAPNTVRWLLAWSVRLPMGMEAVPNAVRWPGAGRASGLMTTEPVPGTMVVDDAVIEREPRLIVAVAKVVRCEVAWTVSEP